MLRPSPRAVLAGVLSVLSLAFPAAPVAAQEKRPLRVDDLFALRDVGDPHLSPDGTQVAFTVKSLDPKKDKSDTDVYVVTLRAETLDDSPRAPRRRRARAGARTGSPWPSCRGARARRHRSTCCPVGAARPRSSPTTRVASRASRGHPTRSGSPSSCPTPTPTRSTRTRGRKPTTRRTGARRKSPSSCAASSSSGTWTVS